MKKSIYTLFGSVILGAGLYFFLLVHDIAAGGISGLSLVLSKATGVNIGYLNLGLNTLVLILGAIFISTDFAKKSIISAIAVSGTIIILETLFPNLYLTNDIIVNVAFGALTVSLGLGLIFYNGGSSGGTDVIASIINKYANIPIHISLFVTDLIVIILSAMVIGIEPALYAVLTIIIQSVGIDYVIQGLGRKIAIVAISDNYEQINEILTKKYKRGVTLLLAEGGYSGREKKLVMTIANVKLYPVIREEILRIDDKAFIFSYTISEVLGEGFTINTLN